MSTNVDLTLFSQIKESFSAKPGTIVFISLTSKNVEELTDQTFEKNQLDDFYELRDEHLKNKKPYAAFSFLYETSTFIYFSREFKRTDNLLTGKIERFELEPFKHLEIDIDKMKQELSDLIALLSNSQAS